MIKNKNKEKEKEKEKKIIIKNKIHNIFFNKIHIIY